MKNDLISRQEAIELCDWYEHEFRECDYVIKVLADDLKILPTAEKEGKWVVQITGWGDVYYECSNCKEAFTLIEGSPKDNFYYYCPCCGARMEE